MLRDAYTAGISRKAVFSPIKYAGQHTNIISGMSPNVLSSTNQLISKIPDLGTTHVLNWISVITNAVLYIQRSWIIF